MNDHVPIILSMNERIELGSITKHPGLSVLIDKIMLGHSQQQLAMIYTVKPDDPDRVTKLDAISSTSYAMDEMLKMVRRELEENWKYLQLVEQKRAQGAGQ